MANKKKNKKEISIMKQLVEEEALDCYLEYDAEYTFHHFSGDVQTVFVYQAIDSNNPVEFHMLERLKTRLKEINSRYMVGIIFQDVPDYEEED